jgi:hypothetical protein
VIHFNIAGEVLWQLQVQWYLVLCLWVIDIVVKFLVMEENKSVYYCVISYDTVCSCVMYGLYNALLQEKYNGKCNGIYQWWHIKSQTGSWFIQTLTRKCQNYLCCINYTVDPFYSICFRSEGMCELFAEIRNVLVNAFYSTKIAHFHSILKKIRPPYKFEEKRISGYSLF